MDDRRIRLSFSTYEANIDDMKGKRKREKERLFTPEARIEGR